MFRKYLFYAFFLASCCFFLFSCGADERKTISSFEENEIREALVKIRKPVLRYLVQKRLDGVRVSSINSIEEVNLFYLLFHAPLAIFQADIVDRSWIKFHIVNQSEETECGVFILYNPSDEIIVNLLECSGPYAERFNNYAALRLGFDYRTITIDFEESDSIKL